VSEKLYPHFNPKTNSIILLLYLYLISKCGFNGIAQGAGEAFLDETAGACVDGVASETAGRVAGDDQGGDFGVFRADRTHKVQPTHIWKCEIDEHQVRHSLWELRERVGAAGRFTTDLEVRRQLDEHSQALAHEFVVFEDENAMFFWGAMFHTPLFSTSTSFARLLMLARRIHRAGPVFTRK
jgi:hypothetical protein